MSNAQVITSDVNTFTPTVLLADSSISGIYADTSGYELVRIWATSPVGALRIYLNFADDTSGGNAITELFTVFAANAASLHSFVKKRYARTVVVNGEVNTPLTGVKVITKYAHRPAHPSITYMSDEITANVTVALEDINVNSEIDNSNQSILMYGSTIPKSTNVNRALRTDQAGCLLIAGPTPYGSAIDFDNGTAPILMGAAENGLTSVLTTDNNRLLVTISGAIQGLSNTGNGVSFVNDDGTVNNRPLTASDVVTVVNTSFVALGPYTVGAAIPNAPRPVVVGGSDYLGSTAFTRMLKVDTQGSVYANISGGITALRPDGTSGPFVNVDGTVNVRPLTNSDTITVFNNSMVAIGPALVGAAIPNSLRPVLIGGSDYTGTPNIRLQKIDANGNAGVALSSGVLALRGDGQSVPFVNSDSTVNIRALTANTDTVTISTTAQCVDGAAVSTKVPLLLAGSKAGNSRIVQIDTNDKLSTSTVGTTAAGSTSVETVRPLVVGGLDSGARVQNVNIDSTGALKVSSSERVGGVTSFQLVCDTTPVAVVEAPGKLVMINLCNPSTNLLFVKFGNDTTQLIRLPIRPGTTENIVLPAPVAFGSLVVTGAANFTLDDAGASDTVYGVVNYF